MNFKESLFFYFFKLIQCGIIQETIMFEKDCTGILTLFFNIKFFIEKFHVFEHLHTDCVGTVDTLLFSFYFIFKFL